MAGILITAKNADFSAAPVGHVGLTTSVTSGLQSLHETRRSAAKTINNSAGGVDASLIGAPTFSAASASFSPANSMLTGYTPESGGLTVGVILKLKTGGGTSDAAFGIDNLGDAATKGSVWLFHYNRRVQLSAYSFPSATPPLSGYDTRIAYLDFTAPDDGRFELFMGVLEDNTSIRLYHPRTAALNTTATVGRYYAFDAAPRLRTAPLAAGAAHDVALTAHWNRVLSPTEMNTFYAEMKEQFARLGLAI